MFIESPRQILLLYIKMYGMNLVNKLNESLLDDEDELVNNDNSVLIEQFLKSTYDIEGTYVINGSVVNVDGRICVSLKKKSKLKQPTNGLFSFGKVTGTFDCQECKSLISLEGAPEIVNGNFYCSYCPKLTSLEGAPKEVGMNFSSSECYNLKTLKGLPKKVSGSVFCTYNRVLEEINTDCDMVGGDFSVRRCKNLKSLKGLPKIIMGDFAGPVSSNITDYGELDKISHGNVYFDK